MATGRDALVRDAVGGWQRHLVDLGGRNTLLWFRDLPSGTLDLTRAHPAGIARLFSSGAAPLTDLIREPAALADAERRARVIRSRTRELAEERGISTCYLAIGMATWDRPGAPRPPAAPVLLRRCEVFTPPGQPDRLGLRLAGDVEFNSVLAKYLQVECGIDLDLTRIDDYLRGRAGSDVGAVLTAVQDACADVPGFRIERRYVVGTFSYTKLPMVRDLADQLGQLSMNHVVAALAGDEEARVQVSAEAPPFAEVDPAVEHLVLDADASQQDVVEAVRAGSHLVVKGPPGTGKSQTIANLVAAVAADGRRVLFVAEKRAAIDAVAKRLAQVGLGELVLDVHGRTGARPGDLVRAMDDAVGADDALLQPVDGLVAQRAQLAEHRRAMHEPHDPWRVTVDEGQTRLSELHAMRPAPRSRAWIDPADLQVMNVVRRQELADELTRIAELGAWRTDDEVDPWFGARVVGAQQAARTHDLVKRLSNGGLREHRDRLDALCDRVGLPVPRTMLDGESRLELMTQAHKTLESFRPEIFEAPLDDMVTATAPAAYRKEHGSDLGVFDRRRLRKEARNLLRPGQPPTDLHGVLVLAAGQRARWREVAGKGARPSAPTEVGGLVSAHERLREDLEWLAARLDGTAEGNDLLDTDLDALQERLDRLAKASDRLALVPTVIGPLDQLRANGLGDLLDDLAARRVPAERVADEFEFVWWRAVLARIAELDPAYGEASGAELRSLAQSYAAADAAHVHGGASRVRASWVGQVRRAVRDFPEQETLLREQARTDRPLPLRELLPQAPELLTAIKPCWAMSPLVVASVVPPGVWFDVVIFDEASQIPSAEAISAIARAGQVVVAGDPRQLPPTSFFRGVDGSDGSDGDAPETSESVLDALSELLPTRELTWHYRALDERLIAFANAQVYGGRLVTFPGVGDDTVVRLDVVDGPTADAESADAEVERVTQVVLDQFRQRPEESIGVITLGQRHADRIESAIRAAVAADPALAGLFEESAEPFFVKNLERVQGDERDAIVLSIGYGRGPRGEVVHRFGPISTEGGERRLNVAMTRARRRMVTVSSFSGDELNPTKLRSRGGLMLRDFLLYAGSGGAARRVHGSGDEGSRAAARDAAPGVVTPGVVRGPDGRRRRAPSTGSVLDRPVLPGANVGPVPPLVLDLASRLRAEGLVVHPGWGTSIHRLDLAVEDPRRPGSLLVAIETDGPTYGSIISTRDRERLRVEQLRRLGWVHERVWTRDLFRDPAREVARLVAAVHAASLARDDADRMESAAKRAANPWLDEE
ncbi:AAA family ATPase [Flexivirga sp. ID2601S]|uniref:AAA family ATPase n=1 Tax=Flexivirga aerilata TaxID=1656889 RepID=A0A849AB56_9MICO|nr:AAA domain-containing protein [Flexivirga aerilata]NNG37755.1 AAA family ATPase [Flexivirga aerilata]